MDITYLRAVKVMITIESYKAVFLESEGVNKKGKLCETGNINNSNCAIIR